MKNEEEGLPGMVECVCVDEEWRIRFAWYSGVCGWRMKNNRLPGIVECVDEEWRMKNEEWGMKLVWCSGTKEL